MAECPTGFTQRWLLEQGPKAQQRSGILSLLHGSPSYDPFECIAIPPLQSTGGLDLGPVGETALQVGLRAFDVVSLGLSSPLTSQAIQASRLEDRPVPLSIQTSLKSQEVPTMNGNGFFSDLFSDVGAFFTTEQTFGETLGNVGADIWQGVTSFLPSLPQVALPIAQQFLPPAPRSGQPSGATPRPSIPELFLPEFLRPSQRSIAPLPLAAPPGRGGWPQGSWESDTFGEPFTFPAGGTAMAAGGVMLPAVRGMGTLALQATVNAMRSQGVPASVSWLAGIIKRWGPAAAVGFLASWVADEIANRAVFEAYAHRRRRMNPANTKALRRSLRRLGSFERLCKRVQHCRKTFRVCK